MVRFRTPYNYVFGESSTDYSVVNDSVSMTEPDQSLSIREIFARAVAGMPLGAPTFVASYPDGDDPDFDDYDPLESAIDLSDYAQAAVEYDQRLEYVQSIKAAAERTAESDGTDGPASAHVDG